MSFNSKVVITDSGGLQKEAYFFKKPCVTLREQTEWVELIEAKVNILTSINKTEILHNVKRSLEVFNLEYFENPLYGDGDAAKKIVRKILEIKVKDV